jgi:hypothetical protein
MIDAIKSIPLTLYLCCINLVFPEFCKQKELLDEVL